MLDDCFIITKSDSKRCAYIKIGDLNALSAMRDGNWWFRHPDYFRYEDIINGDNERGDCEESLIREQHSYNQVVTETIKLQIGSIPPQKLTIHKKEYRATEEIDSERILCFYRLDIEQNGKFTAVDKRMKQFGDYFSFVDIKQLLANLKSMNLCAENFDMKYHENNYSGNIGKEGKRTLYKHQNEHRIWITSNEYCTEIKKDERINSLYRSLNIEEKKVINRNLSSEELFRADKKRIYYENEICKLKSYYKKVISSTPYIATLPLPLCSLYQTDQITDIIKLFE